MAVLKREDYAAMQGAGATPSALGGVNTPDISPDVIGRIACQSYAAALASPGVASWSRDSETYRVKLREAAADMLAWVLAEQAKAERR